MVGLSSLFFHKPGIWTVISDVTLGSDTATHTITGISTDYHSFMLIIVAASTHSAETELGAHFNNDTGGNYTYQYLFGTGTTIGANRATAQTDLRLSVGFTNSATDFETLSVYIPNIATNRKTVLSSGSRNQGGAGIVHLSSLWTNSTDQITEIDMFAAAGSLRQDSRITLLGLKT